MGKRSIEIGERKTQVKVRRMAKREGGALKNGGNYGLWPCGRDGSG